MADKKLTELNEHLGSSFNGADKYYVVTASGQSKYVKKSTFDAVFGLINKHIVLAEGTADEVTAAQLRDLVDTYTSVGTINPDFTVGVSETGDVYLYWGISGAAIRYNAGLSPAVLEFTHDGVSWSELGTGGGGGGATALDGLTDVTLTAEADNDIIQRKAGVFVNRTLTQYKSDLALSNVDNTSDVNKPVSTAQQTALDLKQNSIGYTAENAANKNATNGYPGLTSGKLAFSQIPVGVSTTSVPEIGATLGNSHVVETDASGKLISVAKGTADNKDFGTTAGTVSEGNHTHLAAAITDFNTAALTAAPSETTTTVGNLINGATDKPTPVDADTLGLSDSAASGVLKKLTWANLKATLKTYFDTLYQSILVSGTNIKTINGSTILGSGDLVVSGGSSIPNYATPTGTTTLTHDLATQPISYWKFDAAAGKTLAFSNPKSTTHVGKIRINKTVDADILITLDATNTNKERGQAITAYTISGPQGHYFINWTAEGTAWEWELNRPVQLFADWAVSTLYVVGNQVRKGCNIYQCILAHTSHASSFTTDFNALDKWILISQGKQILTQTIQGATSLDLSTGNYFLLTTGSSNITGFDHTNALIGHDYFFYFTQGATARTIAFATTKWYASFGGPIALTPTAAANDFWAGTCYASGKITLVQQSSLTAL